MSQPIYDTIGKNYNINRAADERITGRLIELLGLPRDSLIADIGAGTGNYSNALAESGYRVIAIEPSETMREQAMNHTRVRWNVATAESLPLSDASLNGVVIVLAVHHFRDLTNTSKELHRVCPDGPVVILTFDPRKGRDFWFYQYFPDIFRREFERFPPAEEVAATLAANQWGFEIYSFALPCDLRDRNMHAGWNRPELYFDEQFRRNVSGFALASDEETTQGLSKLKNDLEAGTWDERYGELRKRETLDTGFVFIKLGTR